MFMGYFKFKYELQRGVGSILTSEELNWFQRLLYRIKGYKVIKLTDDKDIKQRF